MRSVVLAAPSSGSGKTTVATGLMAALHRRGTRVAPFKVGPDYIDPGYHTLAAGAPGRNLDPVMVGPDRVAPLARHGAAGTDVAVVEGVMGLFDGRIGTPGTGSTAEVAALLGAPVVLVVDVRGQSRSLAALLHGFRSFEPGVDVAGVILNRVGSERHAEALRDAADEAGLPVLGALPRRAELVVPSRHLGLVTAAEHGAAAHAAVDAMAELVAAHVDLDGVVALARPLPDGPAWDPAAEIAAAVSPGGDTGARPVVAVAGGPAFGFGYAEHAELLEAAGATVARVDPMRDASLPDGTAALVLPGGFPEEHVAALGENAPLRAEVAALARSGAPVHAECGGLLYLCRELDGVPMCGVLDADARDDRAADAGLPGRRRAHRICAVRAGASGHRPRVPPVRGHAAGRARRRPGPGAVPSRRGSSTAACTRRSCTRTRPAPRTRWRGSSRRPGPRFPAGSG